jgi:peptidoglycan hydrolase CwlO-like protein
LLEVFNLGNDVGLVAFFVFGAMLEKQQKDEEKERDYCIDALNTNERDTENKERDKADIIAQIEDLKQTIEKLDQEIELLKTEIADLEVQLKRAS